MPKMFKDRYGRTRLCLSHEEIDRMRKKITRRGLTPRDACAKAGLPVTSFRRWASGEASPAPDAWVSLNRVVSPEAGDKGA